MDQSNFTHGIRGRKLVNQRMANDQRDVAIKREIENERMRSLAKSARLRALRLEKEAAEKAEAEKQPVRVKKGASKPRVPRVPGY